MIKVSPSVLSANFTRLGADCREVLDAGADMIHFDVHLMITDPLLYIKDFADAGASSISVPFGCRAGPLHGSNSRTRRSGIYPGYSGQDQKAENGQAPTFWSSEALSSVPKTKLPP